MILTYDFARRSWACAVLLVAFSLLGCQADDGTFPCGNGTCDLDTEVCIIGGTDQCAACAPRPAACEANTTCACLPTADDPSWGNNQCDDEGICSESEGGLVLTCVLPPGGCG